MAPPVRFVHCAGFRFDSRSWEGPLSWVDMRNKDLWQTFEAVLTLCQTEKADFLFLAGDLFEQEYARKATVERVARCLARLGQTKVFIVPGEKDPLVTTSAYRFTEWPENVHIFSGELGKVEIPSLGVTVYGAGWTTYRQDRAFPDDLPTGEKAGQIRFLLLHAEVESTRNTEGFIPLQEEQIASSGLTYLALGHKERWSGINQAGETYWADCGRVEARSFSEPGPHGVLLGETDGKTTQIKFLELPQRRYIQKSLLLRENNPQNIVEQLLAETTEQERQKDLFRFKLIGSVSEAEAAVPKLQKLLADKFCFIELVHGENKTSCQLAAANPSETSSMADKKPDGFPALTQVFIEETQRQIAAGRRTEEKRHWELVQKIGLAALTRQISLQAEEQKEASEPVTVAEKAGETILWPESKEDNFYRRVRNLRQVGDEQISLAQVRDSLAGATKKVAEQTESMGQVRAEYEALRQDWEAANRRQEEQRLLQIEIKNLQAKKNHLAEKIFAISKIQERLALLGQNPDYRELRRIQGELSGWEELRLETEAELTAYTRDTQVNWLMIEELREECLKWAGLQKEVEYWTGEIEKRVQQIYEEQNCLQMSGYQNLADNEDQRLRQAEEKLEAAQAELQKLAVLREEIKRTEETCSEEIAKLKDFEVFTGITAVDERKLKKTAERLTKWQSSKISGFCDRVLEEQFSRASVNDRLAAQLVRYYQKYRVTDYDDFKRQQKEFQDRRQVVENLQRKLEQLRKEAGREKELRRIIDSLNEMLKQAYSKVNMPDFPAWLKGWEEYRRRKSQVAEMLDALDSPKEHLQEAEGKLKEYADQLREKLQDWVSPLSDMEEVLNAVLMIARRLRAKEEAEKEFAALKQEYDVLLGKRNMEQLAGILEPLADLEREARLPDEQRQAELLTCQQELAEINRQLANAEKSLQHLRAAPLKPDLEERLEALKLQWKNYEELQRALDSTKDLLEASRQKWQIDYGSILEAKAQRIFSRTFSSPASDKPDKLEITRAEARKYYFSYRLALAELALLDSPQTPLFFSVGTMHEPPAFWEDVLAYLQELSLSREVIFSTSDEQLRQLMEKYNK